MGRALLIAGSRGMAGAAILATGGVLRVGAGYALVDCPGGISAELANSFPEGVLHLHGDSCRAHLIPADLPNILQSCQDADAVGLGPGLGSSADTLEFVEQFLPAYANTCCPKPLVLDADGLNHIAAANVDLHALGIPSLVMTPHPGEAVRLLGWDNVSQVQADRKAAVEELARRTGAVVLLKGAGTLVASPGEKPWLNSTGNPGMATAGSGDVLTGILTGLLARGLPPEAAARLAAHLHGLAGDISVQEMGPESLIASDLIRALPTAILQYRNAS